MDELQRATLKILHKHLRDEIETNWIAEELRRCDVINDEQKHYYEGNDSPSKRAESLLLHLPDNCSMAVFLRILKKVKQEHLVNMIESGMTRLSRLPVGVYHERPVNTSNSFKHYTVVADDLQVRVFKLDRSMKNALPTIALLKTFKQNLREHWDNIFALVDASLGKSRIEQNLQTVRGRSLLQHMDEVMSETSFPLQALMIFESRTAETLALDGKLPEALVVAMDSIQTIDLSEPCRHNGKIIFTFVEIMIQNYFENGDPRLKTSIKNWLKDGYSQFDHDPIVTQRIWKRMYLVLEAFFYLRVKFNSRDADGEITDEDVCRARRCLDKVRLEFWEGIDKRMEILYLRAEAKYALHLRDYVQSKLMLQRGLAIATFSYKKEAAVFRILLGEIGYDSTGNVQNEGFSFIPFPIQETNQDGDHSV